MPKLTKLILFISPTLFSIFIMMLLPVHAQTTDSGTSTITATSTDDHDLDGIPSAWEIFYGFDHTDPADASFDVDNDLLTNLEEYLYGTDPLNPDTDGGTLIDGKEIQEGKDPLDPTDDLEYPEPDDGGRKRPTHNSSLDKRADSDGDGLSNIREKRFGTDPNNKDTDNDGLGDYDEIFTYFTDPLNWDTDADGLLDGDEVFIYFTDPLNRDTDYDKLTDGQEIKIYGTSPTLFDTDFGGISDGDEVLYNNTNPLDPDDDTSIHVSYFINDVSFEEFGLNEINRLELITDLRFSLNITTEHLGDEVKFDVYFDDQVFKNLESVKNLEFVTPKNPGDYELIVVVKEPKESDVQITKQIHVSHRGRVFGRVEGLFGKFFRNLSIGEYGALDNVELTLSKYNEDIDKWTVYQNENLNITNPYKSGDGRYAFLVDPGIYKVTINRKTALTSEVYINADTHKVYSKNIYVTYNFDNYGWALLFVATYHLVYGLYLIIHNNIHRFHHLKHKYKH